MVRACIGRPRRGSARCVKDLVYTDKEIISQKERIERVRADPEKDEHDVRKQEEVLGEYTAAIPDEQDRLHKFYEQLITVIDDTPEELHASEEYEKAKEAYAKARAVLLKAEKIDEEDP